MISSSCLSRVSALHFDGDFAEFELIVVFKGPLYVAAFEAVLVIVEYVSQNTERSPFSLIFLPEETMLSNCCVRKSTVGSMLVAVVAELRCFFISAMFVAII